MVMVTSWGRLGRWEHEVFAPTDMRQVASLIETGGKQGLAYGMGRSYGDVCINPGGRLWRMTGLDRFIAFDAENGILTCEAGILLRDIQRTMIPQGWGLPVTPGTQMVTVGGAIANDVHGKNHHVHGSFGDHIRRVTLLRTDGTLIECGPNNEPQWFAATVGGIGLTGLILSADIQLQRISGPWLETETIPYGTLDEFFALSDSSEADWQHTVSWIDCLAGKEGRGLFMRGNQAKVQAKRKMRFRAKTMPFVLPISAVNRLTLRPFNMAYYQLNKQHTGIRAVHCESFMYPLDNLLEWNRIYGPNGFFQYQSVVPRDGGKDAVQAMLRTIAQIGEGSFLAVLKTFGEREALGMLSFPRPGVTLALDFPNCGERTLKLMERLDAIVGEAGGRIYLAKDARMPHCLFEAGYPRLQEFLAYRDPGISSALSRRLMGS